MIPLTTQQYSDAAELVRRMVRATLALWDAEHELEQLLGYDCDELASFIDELAVGCDSAAELSLQQLVDTVNWVISEYGPAAGQEA